MVALNTLVDAYRRRLAAQNQRSDRFAAGVAYVQGALVPIKEARIPLLDQGFMRSDLVYDVPGVWDGRFFRLDDHLTRLEASCAKLRLRLPMAREKLRAMLVDMVSLSGIRDVYVEIIVTRGLRFVRDCPDDEHVNVLYALAIPYVWILELDQQDRGASAVVTRTVRRVPPGAFDPTIKNLQWGDLIRGLFEARDRSAALPILPDGDGNVTEGAGYNIFVVKGGALRTPRRGVLEGVTRRTVIEIVESKGWRIDIDEMSTGSLYEADELFVTSTAGGVMPISTLDGQPVGKGQMGPVTREIWERYWDLHFEPALTLAIDYG